MKIQAAIFDIGNVLLLFDYMRAARRLMAKNGLSETPDRSRITAAVNDYECGRIDRNAFLDVVRPEFHDAGPPQDFIQIWQEIFDENLPMTALARRLAKTMPVFLISNIGDIHLEFIRREYSVFEIFSAGIYSFEAGIMKPDPRVFDLAVSKFQVDPAHTIYFDDMPENCASAADKGFLVHRYDHSRHADAEAWLTA